MDAKLKTYVKSNEDLVKTLIVKFDKVADSINNFIKLKYGNDSVLSDKSTWKYYLNMSGEYHFSNTIIYVTSLDTLTEIVFSKQNLNIHTATKEGYKYGTRYYKSLVDKYPEQEQLILGILYPVNINDAINATDGTILNYPSELVEQNEITLIPELEIYIKNYIKRWDIYSFSLSDSFYNLAQQAILYLNLLPKLLNLRLKRCKTNEVHSFHLTEYLASHGNLDKYLPFMSLKIALYLYRNILYFEKNNGKTSQLKELIKILLTSNNIPLDELSVRHLDSLDEDYYPNITVRKKSISANVNNTEINYLPYDNLISMTKDAASGNSKYLEEKSNTILNRLQNSNSSIVQTKNLTSNMVDYTDAVPDPLNEVLLRQLASLISSNLYPVVITFKDPKTFKYNSIPALDAFIYMYYIMLNRMNISVETIPYYINIKQQKIIRPTTTYLLENVDYNKYPELINIANELIAKQPIIQTCYSVTSFYDLGFKIYNECLNHWFIISNEGDLEKRAMIVNMISKLYEDEIIELPYHGDNFSTWIENRNLNSYDYTTAEADELLLELFNKMTGINNNANTQLKNIQSAMINIIKQLSSYSIQLLHDVNSSRIKPVNWAAIRVGNLQFKPSASKYIDTAVNVTDVSSEYNLNVDLIDKSIPIMSANNVISLKYNIVPLISVQSDLTINYNIDVYSSSYYVGVDYDLYDENISYNKNCLFYEYFDNLSIEEKRNLKSIY